MSDHFVIELAQTKNGFASYRRNMIGHFNGRAGHKLKLSCGWLLTDSWQRLDLIFSVEWFSQLETNLNLKSLDHTLKTKKLEFKNKEV